MREEFVLTNPDEIEKAAAWLDRRIAARTRRRLTTGNANFSHSRMPPSASQLRLISLLRLPVPDTYIWAARMLKRAGYQPNGLPRGTNWRFAQKMGDKQLVEKARRRK